MSVQYDHQANSSPHVPDPEDAAPIALFLRLCGVRVAPPLIRAQLYNLGITFSETDWQSLGICARVEGMSALVFAHASEAGLLPAMPAEVIEALQEYYGRSWLWNRRLRGEQSRIIALLAMQGIEVMVMKGVTLAERLYGEIALRPIGDIDLLVRPEDISACGRVLAANGYAPQPGRATPSQWHALVNRALALRHSEGFALDVHWALTSQPAYVASFPLAEIWRSARRIQLAGHPARQLSTADELRFLCFHYAAQHEDKRLIWLVDIAEILRTLPVSWDWEPFTATTSARGLAMPVSEALRAAAATLAAPIPTDVLDALAEAAARPGEQAAWRAARTNRRGLRAMYDHIRAQRGVWGQLNFAWQGFLWHGALPAWQRFIALRRALPVPPPPRAGRVIP